MNNTVGYKLPYGKLYVYGENLQGFIPYMDKIINSVEDVCIYSQAHRLRILYCADLSLYGVLEYFRVKGLVRKYRVQGTWKDVSTYLKKTSDRS